MFKRPPVPKKDDQCILCGRTFYNHEQYEVVRTKRKDVLFFHTSCYIKQIQKQKGESNK